jgi:hypothetical protein
MKARFQPRSLSLPRIPTAATWLAHNSNEWMRRLDFRKIERVVWWRNQALIGRKRLVSISHWRSRFDIEVKFKTLLKTSVRLLAADCEKRGARATKIGIGVPLPVLISIVRIRSRTTNLSRCVFYIMGRAIIIAVILQSDPSTKMYMGLRAGKQLNQEYTHIQWDIVEMGRFRFLNLFKKCSRRATVYVQAPPPWNVPPCSTPCHRLGRLTFVISNRYIRESGLVTEFTQFIQISNKAIFM